MVDITAIKPQEIEQQWDTIKPFISRALEHSLKEYSADDLKHKMIKGEYLLLGFYDGGKILAIVSAELLTYPRKKIVNIVTAAGSNMDSWLDEWWNAITVLAKEQGADEITVSGRVGWLKALKKYGFKRQYTVLAVKL